MSGLSRASCSPCAFSPRAPPWVPLTGDTSRLNLLLERLSKLPDYQPQMVGEATPTVRALLSSADPQVEPAKVPWAARRYQAGEALRARINVNTIVTVDGRIIRVTTGAGNDHLRPLLPVGELPLKWRAAISAKINGAIRRHLKGEGQVYGPVERLVQYGPVERRTKYGPKLPPKYGPKRPRKGQAGPASDGA